MKVLQYSAFLFDVQNLLRLHVLQLETDSPLPVDLVCQAVCRLGLQACPCTALTTLCSSHYIAVAHFAEQPPQHIRAARCDHLIM